MLPFNPHKLDVRRFCDVAGHLEGEANAAAMTRLATKVRWQVQGLLHGRLRQQHPMLRLRAEADVLLTCQRCLQALPLKLQAERRFLFAPNETLAVRWDAEQEDLADIDVLVITSSLDVPNLAEEELLLHLPYAPMHSVCEAEFANAADTDDAISATTRGNPFAKLAALKKS